MLGLIALLAIGAHMAVLIVRLFTGWLIGSKVGSINKAQTLTRFIASLLIFATWFIAIGFALHELNVPLQTYLASATIIGLAVSFGSQSLVQDLISGLTLIFGGLLDVGDMVDIGGQVGVVETIGIRYTELRNIQGATVFIPNRNVTNVIIFPVGYIRAFVDVRLPVQMKSEAEQTVRAIAAATHSQFSGIMIREPSVDPMRESTGEAGAPPASTDDSSSHYLRIKFRIWPGQGGVIENAIRQRLITTLREIDPEYRDWMVAVHYRVEPAFKRRAVSAFEAFRKRRAKRQ